MLEILSFFGPLIALGIVGFFVLMFWSLFWKAFALFEAAHRHEKTWFLLLLLINTCGILEIVYLFFITKSGIKRSALWQDTRTPNIPTAPTTPPAAPTSTLPT
jgi:hypothetical protein